MGKIPRLALIVLSILTLTGCAERWEKPGATEQDFDAMKVACSNLAAKHFPPMMRQVPITNGYTTPVTTTCNSHGDSVTCSTRGGDYVPPLLGAIDDNEESRDQAIRACFFEKGWRPAKDD
jgi:uncharacterized lipoprotein